MLFLCFIHSSNGCISVRKGEEGGGVQVRAIATSLILKKKEVKSIFPKWPRTFKQTLPTKYPWNVTTLCYVPKKFKSFIFNKISLYQKLFTKVLLYSEYYYISLNYFHFIKIDNWSHFLPEIYFYIAIVWKVRYGSFSLF